MSTGLARPFLFIVGLCLTGHTEPAAGEFSAKRVVSLDYCADQYVLKLVDRSKIAALSMDAGREFSYMREKATGLRQIRPSAESVLALRPDFIVRSYGGGPNAAAFYRGLGLPVLQISYTSTINQVQQEIERIGDEFGVAGQAALIIVDMKSRLAQAAASKNARSLLYVTPGGITSGPGSLVHELIEAAGFTNFQSSPGWQPLPLEKLTMQQPEMLATAFYGGNKANHRNFWSAARHPIIRDQLDSTRSITLDSATTTCGGWFLVDAVEKLAAGAES